MNHGEETGQSPGGPWQGWYAVCSASPGGQTPAGWGARSRGSPLGALAPQAQPSRPLLCAAGTSAAHPLSHAGWMLTGHSWTTLTSSVWGTLSSWMWARGHAGPGAGGGWGGGSEEGPEGSGWLGPLECGDGTWAGPRGPMVASTFLPWRLGRWGTSPGRRTGWASHPFLNLIVNP